MSLDKIQFFGAVDRKGKKKDGAIASPLPCWYFPRKVEELEHEVQKKKRDLATGMLHPTAVPQARFELEQGEKRLAEIRKAHVKLTGKEKDEAKLIYDDMAKQIGDSMFTMYETKKGLADPHEEVRRMKEPIISIASKHKQLMKNLNVREVNGKISRDDASRVYKILGKSLGENTNTERLRKEGVHPSYQGHVSMDELNRMVDGGK